MKAVVMAGGEGSRLRPLTLARPKPMLPVVNRPVLGHILYLLKKHNITDVVMTLQYLAAQIQDYYGDGRALGMNIEYVVEESPLGTAGSVKHALDLLPDDEPFLVISGDALTDFDLSALIQFHRARGSSLTMALSHVENPLEYGVINVNETGRVSQFLEKPSWGKVTSDTVNTGIYVVEPELMRQIPANTRLDWSQDIFPEMLQNGNAPFGWIAEGYWCDIGTLSEYHRANADLLSGRLDLDVLGRRVGADIYAAGQVTIAPDAQLFGPIYLGEEVKIKRGVIVQGPAVIRDYTILDDRARVHHTIIWRNCYIGEGVILHGAVVGRQCSLKARSMVFEGAVVGDGTIVGEDAIIQTGVKIWPGKEVENGARVNHSVIWGSQGRRVLFGRYGVTGVVNVDLTPDFVARLGAAFGSVLPRGSTVTINRDPHRSSRMIKRALISGLPSAGSHVLDLQSLPIPVARYHTRAIHAAGGVHVRLAPYDPRVVDIRFMGGDGLNLTRDQERAIERVFFREDYRRVYLEDIGNIEYAVDAIGTYAQGFQEQLDVQTIKAAALRVVVDYANSPTADVLPHLLERLGVDVVPLNPRVDTAKLALAQDELRAGRAQLARVVSALNNVHLGIRLDVGGEKIFVADDTGVSVDDRTMAVALAALVLRHRPGATIVVTVDQPNVYESLAEQYGGRVQRCAVDSNALMRAAAEDGVAFATDGSGNFVFPDLHPVIDGLFSAGKLLELLARERAPLSQVIAQLPPFFVAGGQVDAAWETKGRVMRCLIDQFSRLRHETIDGIKIFVGERDWVLIRPDNDTSTFHITAEAHNLALAQELVADYGGLVRSYILEPPCANPGAPTRPSEH